MYTLREICAKDFVGTLEKVADIGYAGVELAGLYSLGPGEVKEVLDDLNLKLAGNHVPGERDLDKLIRINNEMGCTAAWGPCMPEGKLPTDEAGCIAMAEYADRVGAKMKRNGIQLYYHNHSQEFQKINDRYIMDWLLEETDPDSVAAEIDVMWVQHAGVDPAAYIRKYPGRVPLAHIKDMDEDHAFTEVGQGILDFDSIFAACEKVGTKWYIVEQDTCKRDPLESVKMSFDYFKDNEMI